MTLTGMHFGKTATVCRDWLVTVMSYKFMPLRWVGGVYRRTIGYKTKAVSAHSGYTSAHEQTRLEHRANTAFGLTCVECVSDWSNTNVPG